MLTKIQKILKRLVQLHPKSIDLSLDRIKRLLKDLNNPEKKITNAIQVVGTNGKFSFCSSIKEILEIFGDQVIPEFDKDPVHSTTKMRETAQPKFPAFNNELPAEVNEVTVIPDSAILPLSA